MTDDVRQEIQKLRATVQSIDERLASGNIPTDDIEGLKAAVDDMRLRIWASMNTSRSDDTDALGRFRLRRAIDMCRSLTADLVAGKIGKDAPGMGELAARARAFVDALPAEGPKR